VHPVKQLQWIIISQAPDWLETTPSKPNHTRLRAIESDVKPLNSGASHTWNLKKTSFRDQWRSIMDKATLKKRMRGDRYLTRAITKVKIAEIELTS